jgi:hypothetical protein
LQLSAETQTAEVLQGAGFSLQFSAEAVGLPFDFLPFAKSFLCVLGVLCGELIF